MRGTLSDQFRGKHPFFWVVVIAAVWSLCHWGFSVAMLYKYGGQAKAGFWVDQQFRIYHVTPGGPAVGKLQQGDQIRAVNGVPVTEENLAQTIYGKFVGTNYTLEIERAGSLQPVELTLQLHAASDRSAWHTPILWVLVGLSFLFVGLLAGFLQPADRTVRLLSATFIIWSLSAPAVDIIFSLLNATERQTVRFFQLFVVIGFTGAMLFHLFLRFPPGLPVNKFLESVKWVFYVVAITEHALFLVDHSGLMRIPQTINLLMMGVLIIVTGPAIVLVVIRGYRLTREPQQRQRIKWIINSVILAISVSLIQLILAYAVWPRLNPQPGSVTAAVATLLLYVSFALILSIPVTWAYAILKHRVLDINVVIRRSLRYLLASRGFILVEALLAFALLSFIFAGRLGVWLDRFGSNTRTLITILGTVLMVLGLQSVNRKIRPLIDRRFFRDAYDAQQILTELGSSLRATTNVNQVLELTTAKIQQALYAANVTIFLRNGQHDFQSAVSRDYHEREKSSQSVARELHLPDDAFVVQRIGDSSQPAEIDWDDPYSPVATQLAAMANGDATAQQEFDTLRTLKTNLVLPLAAKDELLGVLALGPRAGDLPYSREDKRMLMNVAGQTAMALENSRLVEQMIEEARRREEIETENEARAKELEDARRLQLSMLPKGNVRLERLEITGAMRTATEVGGDYYDFLPMPDGRYCVVIGDATGHGMSAGLIVGMVKMGLTSRLQITPNLQPMIEDLNAALKQSLTHRGVGMCLGATMIDPVTLQVELCSNGMPFPYYFANGALRAIELKAQPLGFLKRVNVPTATLQLQSGDALIWVSDGFEERMNAQNEEWGVAQVAAALTEICQHETSGEAIARELIAACDRAADGRSNNDDMTIVVIKALSGSA